VRWIVSSWASACAGALAAGIVESAAMGAGLGAGAGAGFVVLALLPALFVLSIIVRGLAHAWAPVLRGLVEPHGGAPRLAAWCVYVAFALVALAAGSYGATMLLATATKFRPMVVGYAQPVFAITIVVVLLAASRPVAGGLAMLFARRGAAFRPRRIALALAVVIALLAGGAWWFVRPRIGPLDLAPAITPAVGIAGLVVAHVVIARWERARMWMAAIASGFAAAVIACALLVWRTQPGLTLEVWGSLPVAGFVIDKAFDLESIRDRIALDTFRPAARPDATHPDVVVIIVDTMRADRTELYGGPAAMPFLAELGKRGVVFEHAFSPSNVTRRSIPSMLTGLSPQNVRGRVVGWALRIDPRHVVLGERMAAAGYDTAGFVCCGGFYGDESHTGLSRGLDHLVVEKNGSRLAQLARTWLEQRERTKPTKPLFLYMHILDPHNWAGTSDPPMDLALRLRMYDRTLTLADKMISGVLGAFHDREPGRAPIVVVTADHAEALGDHGEPFHSTDLYNSQIHVPFVIAGPGIATKRITETVSLTDLAPTVLELAGYTPPPMDGRSLASLATGARESTEQGVAYAAMIKDRSNPGGVSAIVRGSWKLIVTGNRRELYDIKLDPRELSDRAASKPDLVRELAALLAEHEQ
jgi:choline-sulfatase